MTSACASRFVSSIAPMPRTTTYGPAFFCSCFRSSTRPGVASARAVAEMYVSRDDRRAQHADAAVLGHVRQRRYHRNVGVRD
eukprot:5345818-Prymnesium_polylepis.1